MRICIPVTTDKGLASPVSRHFGSAPFFLIVDHEAGTCRSVPNRNRHHAHGLCQPLTALAGEDVDAILVGGIGVGALNKLLGAGLEVYRAEHPTVDQALAAFETGRLRAMGPDDACAHHGRGEGQGRDHANRQ